MLPVATSRISMLSPEILMKYIRLKRASFSGDLHFHVDASLCGESASERIIFTTSVAPLSLRLTRR
ncbi:hypothetical protein BGLA2_300060 [Burkholderia gladioli]|nr:hypothetical protein BGLA2_300060 [Burkholderia gladioli]